MARVPNIQREQLASEPQHHYDAIASTRGYVGPNFAVLFNSPEATGRFAAFGESVRYHGAVPPRLKELAIITAARAANNAYVWTAHERLAREHGVTDAIIDAIRNRTAPDGLTGDDAKVVRFTSELLTTHEIADDTFDAMHQMLGHEGTIDLILLMLYYLNVAPTKPWSPCKPHTVRRPRNQAAARACRSSS
jgi:4-carboxymuconolactone decarboxylase